VHQAQVDYTLVMQSHREGTQQAKRTTAAGKRMCSVQIDGVRAKGVGRGGQGGGGGGCEEYGQVGGPNPICLSWRRRSTQGCTMDM
jgi:hypothetical protein